MSDYHILEIDEKGKNADVIFHIATPAGNNAVGTSYATCLTEDPDISVETTLPAGHLGLGEDTALAAGTLYEHRERVEFADTAASNAAKQAEIQARYTALVNIVQTRIQERYRFWGYSGDVN